MPLYDFSCSEGHLTERLAPRDTELVSCACGLPARRSEVYRIGVSGFAEVPTNQKNYRQEFREYREASMEVDYHYTKREQAGEPVKSPDLFGEAVGRVRAMQGNAAPFSGIQEARKQGLDA